MRVAARDGGFFYDRATASEVVAQTQKILETSAVKNLTGGTRPVKTN